MNLQSCSVRGITVENTLVIGSVPKARHKLLSGTERGWTIEIKNKALGLRRICFENLKNLLLYNEYA